MRWAYGVISAFKEHGREIINNKKLSIEDKAYAYLTVSGYAMSFLLMGLFLTGFVSFITHEPEPINFLKFLSGLGINIILTSGLVVTAVAAQSMSKNTRSIPSMIASFFSYGLIVVYYVNKGIFRVAFNKPMQWYLLNKNANKAEC